MWFTAKALLQLRGKGSTGRQFSRLSVVFEYEKSIVSNSHSARFARPSIPPMRRLLGWRIITFAGPPEWNGAGGMLAAMLGTKGVINKAKF